MHPIIESLLDQLASGDQVEAYRAYQQLVVRLCQAGKPGSDEARAAAAQSLADALSATVEQGEGDNARQRPKYSPAVRGQIARLLSLVASASEVPALVAMLSGFNTREMGRWALDQTTSDEATAALVATAVEGVGPEYRVGAINALANRGGEGVVGALKQCSEDADLEVRLAAIEALSGSSDAEADPAIASVLAESNLPARARSRAVKARVRLAESLAKAQQKAAAKAVYQAVLASDPDEPQRAAAQRGLDALA